MPIKVVPWFATAIIATHWKQGSLSAKGIAPGSPGVGREAHSCRLSIRHRSNLAGMLATGRAAKTATERCVSRHVRDAKSLPREALVLFGA